MTSKLNKKRTEGSYYQPIPLDFEILKRLPLEGSTIGFHHDARTVSYLKGVLNKELEGTDAPKLTGDQMSGRLQSMRREGFVTDVPVTGSGSTSGWQRTRQGEKFYTEKTGKPLSNASPDLKVVGE